MLTVPVKNRTDVLTAHEGEELGWWKLPSPPRLGAAPRRRGKSARARSDA